MNETYEEWLQRRCTDYATFHGQMLSVAFIGRLYGQSADQMATRIEQLAKHLETALERKLGESHDPAQSTSPATV